MPRSTTAARGTDRHASTTGHVVGNGSYPLQREFNNAGMIESDPNAPGCAPLVDLAPTFVAPSPIDPGDVVAFDGSVTDSTLMVPQAGYAWNFGDGQHLDRYGASLVHTFTKGRHVHGDADGHRPRQQPGDFSSARHRAGSRTGGPPPPPPGGVTIDTV